MIIKDNNSGQALFECNLPDSFVVEAYKKLETFPDDQRFHIEINAKKDNCEIHYQSGDTYLYEKKKAQIYTYVPIKEEKVTSSGAIRSIPVSLREEMDQIAKNIIGNNCEMKDYCNLSSNLVNRLKNKFNQMVNNFVYTVEILASFQPIAIGTDIRNYLFDGGIGVYESNDKIIAVCLSRMGIEYDIVQRQGILENLSNELFGKANDNPYVASSNCEWNNPFISYLITDNKQDLTVFLNFVDSIEETDEFYYEAEQLRKNILEFQLNKARNEAMNNQAMWNMAFANQQQQFEAMDRLSNTIHQDLDQFHNNLFFQMNQNDMRINSNVSAESIDDKIQRMRHESMMGVETYERNDGSTVEYSSMADRVFESNLDSTSHFGTHHYFDDYIPEGWHELKKK